MLRTIDGARSCMLALPKNRERRAHLERARRLLQEQVCGRSLALSRDDKLDVFVFEHITGARRWRGAHKPEED